MNNKKDKLRELLFEDIKRNLKKDSMNEKLRKNTDRMIREWWKLEDNPK